MKKRANKQSQINRREKREMNRENKPRRIVIIEEKPQEITESKPKVETRDASTQVTGQFECTCCRKWVRHLVACHECLRPRQPPPRVPPATHRNARFNQRSPHKRHYSTNRFESRKIEERRKRQFQVETQWFETSILHNRDMPFNSQHTFYNNRRSPPATTTQPENNDDFDNSRQEDLLPIIE